jgi:bifunctional UDP-N-acetylglucosamine pyrophosphorylase/glucosamine-1-phosphate N-acetyltransferase
VLHALDAIDPENIKVVVGAGREMVEAHLEQIAPDAIAVFQAERNGTGHAVQIALEGVKGSGQVLILAGDTPMLSGETLKEFVAAHLAGGFSASVMTAEHPDPTGYGRIIRSNENLILKIVEEKDASDDEKLIFEVNAGVYLFDLESLTRTITKLKSNNAQGELYLTDVVELIRAGGGQVAPIVCEDFTETLGVNDRIQLAEAAAILRDRINQRHMQNGVSILDPTTTWIDDSVTIASDVTVLPGSWILGSTAIATGAVIGPRTTLQDCAVNSGAVVKESNCTASEIGANAVVGPFTYLRAGTVLANESKAGAFVEIKNSQIGIGSKVPHLSYIGDANIGEGTNIGAATIVVNYDGVTKHRTEIGDHVRIGSDTMLIAPVSVGDGAYTAAGSVITEDVPSGAIGVARSKQRNVLGWVLRKRPGTKSAKAAEKAEKGE